MSAEQLGTSETTQDRSTTKRDRRDSAHLVRAAFAAGETDPDDEADEADERVGSVVDPITGLPRVMSRKCDTCIFRPGNLMRLAEGRRDEMVGRALLNASWIPCHDTLSQEDQGICRGFYDVHGEETGGVNLARYFAARTGLNWPADFQIDPPAKPVDSG